MMDLIAIGNNVLINADKIDFIEIIETKKGRELTVLVSGKRFTVNKNIKEFLNSLKQNDLIQQFWAG